MGIIDKAKDLGQTAKQKAKEATIKGIDMLSEEDVADLIMAATAKQEKINAVLEAKGSPFRVGAVSISLGPPPSVSMGVIRG